MKIWRLKRGGDIRFRQGHPWIFSGELSHSQRDVEPGEVVELRDASDHFMAYGMAHPASNICFRRLTSRSREADVLSVDFFLRRFEQARALRTSTGWTSNSYRWIFAEADGLPGLVADVFQKGDEDLTVFQISTAGMGRVKDELLSAFEKFGRVSVIENSHSSQRKTEGLTPLERHQWNVHTQLEQFPLQLKHRDTTISLLADMAGGQKTGFFLDQQWNSQLLLSLLAPRLNGGAGELRVLDLCSYVGQWSTQIAKLAETLSVPAHFDVVDASTEALNFAEKNVAQFGGTARPFQTDITDPWPAEWSEGTYDVVICDPPAFVKKKADLAKGMAAYVRLNREAIRRVKPGGLIVTCSCSGAVRDSDFTDCLNAAKAKAGRTIHWLAQGGHGPDHPVLLEFPEGQYLKCRIGQVNLPY